MSAKNRKESVTSADCVPSTSAGGIVKNYRFVQNFQQANITADNFHIGSGNNINNPSTFFYLNRKELQKTIQKDCNELKKFLKVNAEKNCCMEGVTFVQEDQHYVDYVPLQMTQYKNKDESDFKDDGQHARDLQPSGNLKLENLFQKSREYSEKSPEYKAVAAAAASKEAKSDQLTKLSRVVCVITQAGMGKSCLAKQALKLVVHQKLKVDYVFYLKFRDIDYQRETNLLSFLTANQQFEHFHQQRISEIIYIISKNKKTLLVLDGVDESPLTFDNETAINVHDKAKPESFIMGLLSGAIFPHAKILLTSRPYQLFKITKKYRPHYIVQITGISKSSQRKICEDICGDRADAIFKHVQNYNKLSYFCSIPLMCVIIFYCLYKIPKANQNFNLPTTLTEIYVLLILLYIKEETHSQGNINLKCLCTLAWNGISNRKFYFDNNDMKDAGLANIEKNDFTVTLECKVKKNNLSILTHDSAQYTYFSHLSIVEFLATMHVVFFEKNLEDFKELISPHLHGLNLYITNYDMFSLFIFGLCNQSTFSQYFSHDFPVEFNHDLYNQKVMMTKQFLQNIPLTYHDSRPTEFSLKKMDWLYQLNDVTLTQQFADLLKYHIDIYTNEILPNYYLPLNYLLRHRREEIVIYVWCYDGGERFLEELGSTMKENHNVKLKRLHLHTKLTALKVFSFAICLRKVKKEIRILYGFASCKAALNFANVILQREKPLNKIACNEVKLYHFRIRITLRRCQEKVTERISIYTNRVPL